MKLTTAFAIAAVLAANFVRAHPIQADEALSEIIARSGIQIDEPAVQLTQRGTDINSIRQVGSTSLPRDAREAGGTVQDEQIVKRNRYGELINALDAMSTSDLYQPPSRTATFITKLVEPNEDVKKVLEDKFFYWEHSNKKTFAKELREWEKEQERERNRSD